MDVQSKNAVSLYTALERGYTINKKGVLFNPKGLRVVGSPDRAGYLKTTIWLNSMPLNLYVHKYSAFCKFGVKIFETECIRHLDGNPQNNSWVNLALGTRSDNQMDIPKHIRRERAALGFKQYNHEQVLGLHNEGKSYKDIMRTTGIKSKGTVSYILKHSLLVDR